MLKAEFEFIPGRMVGNDPDSLPEGGGVYIIVMPGRNHEVNRVLLERAGATDFFATWPLLYVGATDDSLRSRLKAHYRRDSRGSTFRRSLGLFAQEALGLEVQHLPGNRLFCFHNETPLTSWLEAETVVGLFPCDEPFVLERDLLSATPGLLNLKQREETAVTLQLRDLRSNASRRGQFVSI